MLRKLMKHEFRATGRIMLPVFALVIGLPNLGKSGGEADGCQKYIGG